MSFFVKHSHKDRVLAQILSCSLEVRFTHEFILGVDVALRLWLPLSTLFLLVFVISSGQSWEARA